MAINDYGEASISPKNIIGYSGEDEPLLAPINFKLLDIKSPNGALFQWNSVPTDSVRGELLGYKIRIWTQQEEELYNISLTVPPKDFKYKEARHYREIYIQPSIFSNAYISGLRPNAKTYAQIYIYNRKYHGPPSKIVSFQMPEGKPSQVDSFKAHQLGATAFYLKWTKPLQHNGILTGYNIYYAEVNGSWLGNILPRNNQINNPNKLKAKLANLLPNTKYRLYITATTKVGESGQYFIEEQLEDVIPTTPAIPSFVWKDLTSNRNETVLKITWLPNFSGNPGDHFYVKYNKQIEVASVVTTAQEYEEDFIIINGLELQQPYEFVLIAVDGEYENTSEVKEITLGSA